MPDVESSETWLPVVGWEGLYEVSDLGRVRSLARMAPHRFGMRRVPAKFLTPSPNNHGVVSVGLYDGFGKRSTQRVAQLVMEAFVGPRPLGADVCHWNDVPSDNRLTNLRYDSRSANQDDAVRNGKNPRANQTHCIRGHEFNSANTRIIARSDTGRDRRVCRACSRIRDAKFQQRKAGRAA